MENILFMLGLKFRESKIEIAYAQNALNFQTKVFFVLNIILCLIVTLDSILYFNPELPTSHLYFRFVICGFLLFLALTRKRLMSFYNTGLIFCGLAVYFYYTWIITLIDIPMYLLTSNIFNIAVLEFGMLFCVQNYWVRVFIQIYVCILNQTIRSDWSSTVTNVGMLCGWILYEREYRIRFRELSFSTEKLKKFKDFVDEDLPSCIVVVNQALEVRYSNKNFDFIFKDKDGLNSLKTKNLFKSNLSNILEYLEMITRENMSLTKENSHLIATRPIEDGKKIYEVKIKKIDWDFEECYAVVLNDISEREKLMTATKISEYKDQVIAAVSHELRTPINGILGMVGFLIDSSKDLTTIKYLQNCRSCANLLLNFVNSILDIHQIRAQKLKLNYTVFPIQELIEEIKSVYEYQASAKGIDFKISTTDGVPSDINCDKNRLLQILINLTSNAFKFTSHGSVHLEIKMTNDSQKKLMFSVIDSGLGIKSEDLSRLFQRFGRIEQSDETLNSQGVGLGLMISNELVKILNSDPREHIKVESRYLKGSKFSFNLAATKIERETDDLNLSTSQDILIPDEIFEESQNISDSKSFFLQNHFMPLRSFHRDSLSNTPKSSFDPKSNVIDCLVVDDNPFNILSITHLLKKMNMNVVSALGGEQALELLDTRKFNLIFLDINMPGIDGFETCSLIKKKVKNSDDVAIVALSANDEEFSEKYIKFGFIDLLHKPLDEKSLRNNLKGWITKF